jgi:predicted ester cyclase
MAGTDIREIARRLIVEDLNTGDPSAAAQIIHHNFHDHTNPPDLQRGLDGHNGIVKLFHDAFPDIRWDIDEMLADGDKVVLRLTMHGTQDGDFFGIPPTNREVTVSGTHIVRIEDGKVVEHWGNNDDLGLMRQLGVWQEPSGDLQRLSSREANKAVVRRFVDEYQSQGREEVADELLAPDFVDHSAVPGFGADREGVKQFFAMLRRSFPDLQAVVHDQLCDDERVVTRKTFVGTQQEPFMGIPATGHQVSFDVIDIVRVVGGLMVEHWNVVDQLGFMRQLGALPDPVASQAG